MHIHQRASNNIYHMTDIIYIAVSILQRWNPDPIYLVLQQNLNTRLSYGKHYRRHRIHRPNYLPSGYYFATGEVLIFTLANH